MRAPTIILTVALVSSTIAGVVLNQGGGGSGGGGNSGGFINPMTNNLIMGLNGEASYLIGFSYGIVPTLTNYIGVASDGSLNYGPFGFLLPIPTGVTNDATPLGYVRIAAGGIITIGTNTVSGPMFTNVYNISLSFTNNYLFITNLVQNIIQQGLGSVEVRTNQHIVPIGTNFTVYATNLNPISTAIVNIYTNGVEIANRAVYAYIYAHQSNAASFRLINVFSGNVSTTAFDSDIIFFR